MKEFFAKIWGYVEDAVFGSENIFSNEEIYALPRVLNEHPYIFSIFHYKNSRTKKIIWNIKYRGDKKITNAVAKIMYDHILEDIGEKISMYNFEKPIVIPIPATARRFREHGFNQCERIVRALESIDKNNSFETEYEVLTKTKETRSQAHTKGRTARLANLKNSFGICSPEKIEGRNIILIDDVWTTGATMEEAQVELLKAGARKVVAYTIAH